MSENDKEIIKVEEKSGGDSMNQGKKKDKENKSGNKNKREKVKPLTKVILFLIIYNTNLF